MLDTRKPLSAATLEGCRREPGSSAPNGSRATLDSVAVTSTESARGVPLRPWVYSGIGPMCHSPTSDSRLYPLFEDLPKEIPNLRAALRVLSALIAPAILILACAALVQLASTLLNNVIERTRHIEAAVRELGGSQDGLALLIGDLARSTRRSRLLQRAVSSLLFAIATIVSSSVFFGIVAVWLPRSAWLPILLTVIGVGLIFYACVILALDSWVGVKAVDTEMALMRRRHDAGRRSRRSRMR